MGLSLCYELRLQGDALAARALLQELHRFARSLEFAEVFDLVELAAPDRDFTEQDDLDAESRQLLQTFARQYGQKRLPDGRDIWVEIPAQHILAFGIQPASGSETAQFGLASHQTVVEHAVEGQTLLIETDLAGTYSWAQCCKTQYAGLAQHGGVENFLFAHTGLVRCLDFLASSGVEVDVKDDSGYWEHRDEAKLRQSLRDWNEMVAALAGQLKDQSGTQAGYQISSPILNAPDFEHLEARGLRDWSSREDTPPEDPPLDSPDSTEK